MRSRSAGPAISLTFVIAAGVFASACGHLSSDSPDGPTKPTSSASALPTASSTPTASPTGSSQVTQPPPRKLDLLFSIDNSASMGDKQAYLEQAIPDLINRLVTPNCIDANGSIQGVSTSDGSCAAGSTVEFPPVHDMHIGIVSSSLGPRLGDKAGSGTGGACLPSAVVTIDGVGYPAHNDDQAHLLSRSSTPGAATIAETPLADAPSGFLAWFPSTSDNSGQPAPTGAPVIASAATLESDFADLVAGVHQYGCGIESQLESWYRFLIQPDPYASLALDASEHAQWVGVDTTILQERKDFLRPDSLVAVIVLSDENDSEIDVRSLGGQGYLFMSTEFDPPHGTSACATNPADPACKSCGAAGSSDPACTTPYDAITDWGYDLNLRHAHMKAKYGVDPQFPLTRYVNGLTSATVPDRAGEYPAGATSYTGTNDCVSPLFAASLPDPTTLSSSIASTVAASDEATLCKLPAGTRSPHDVFYAIIGGVPNTLLHYDPSGATNAMLSAADWVKILGNDPDNYDYSGIDPHMIESQTPRAGVSSDWVTNVGPHTDLNVDLEYACTFPLAVPRDCTQDANRLACDCSAPVGTLDANEIPPVCDTQTSTLQIAAKAYPTIRELELAKQLGTQGIAASICPIDVVDNAQGNDPLYGYRPVADTIVNRFRATLALSK